MAQELLKLTGPVLLCRRKRLWVLMISLAAPRMVEIKRPPDTQQANVHPNKAMAIPVLGNIRKLLAS